MFAGEVYKKPEIKQTQTGVSFTRFMIKVDRSFGEGFTFIPVQAWRNIADKHAAELDEGSKVFISGSYETHSYEKDGEKVYAHNFVARSIMQLDQGSSIDDIDLPF